jgi:hypothetical protein
LSIPTTTASTTTSSGALVVGNGTSGGLGVGGNVTSLGFLLAGNGASKNANTDAGFYSTATGNTTLHVAGFTGGSQSADILKVSLNGISEWLAVKASGQVACYATTASTTTSSGALVVSGGVGVAGAITAGGTLRVVGSSQIIRVRHDASNIEFTNTAQDAYVTGTVIGNTLQLHGNNGTGLTIGTTGNATFAGNITTGAPSGGTAAAWKLGTVATVSPTSPNRTIEVDIGGTIYYIHAKTTNN